MRGHENIVPSVMTSYLDFRDRQACFSRMDEQAFDLAVIGAGITGAGIARDAALRGLSVALIEAGDIASGTSSRSSKMIHGGLRYLAHGDIALVREAALERQTLRRIAPHLTRYSEFIVPGPKSVVTKMRAGLTAFERLGGVAKSERHRVVSGEELRGLEPLIDADRYAGAVIYPEFLTNDARLTLANVRSAVEAGAVVLTHAPVVRIISQGGQASGVECRGALPGETLGATVSARTVVNAAGPWVDAVRSLEAPGSAPQLTLTKGIHIVVRHETLPVRRCTLTIGADKRPVFAVPVQDMTYIGTTDTFYPDAEVWPRIDRNDVDYLLDAIASTFSAPRIDDADVVAMWAGVRPLVAQAGKKPSEISRKDETWIGPSGVRSIAGGKLTAYRKMAERVVDDVVKDLRIRADKCSTDERPLVGGDVVLADAAAALPARIAVQEAKRLAELYGSEATDVAAEIASEEAAISAEVAQAVQREGALCLDDYWVRRSARAWFSGDPVGESLDQAGIAMAPLLGWDDSRLAAEIQRCRALHAEARSCLATPD